MKGESVRQEKASGLSGEAATVVRVKHWAHGQDCSPAYFHATDALRSLDVICQAPWGTPTERKAILAARAALRSLADRS